MRPTDGTTTRRLAAVVLGLLLTIVAGGLAVSFGPAAASVGAGLLLALLLEGVRGDR
jgi:hypothetical protein